MSGTNVLVPTERRGASVAATIKVTGGLLKRSPFYLHTFPTADYGRDG
jgi:hypothetical protein